MPLAAQVVVVVAMVVEPGASQPQRVLLRVLVLVVVAIAVEPLVVEMGGMDLPIPSQTSPALAVVGHDPHHLRVRDLEGTLPLLFLILPTTVDLEAQALPIMLEGVAAAPAQAGAAAAVPVRAVLHSRRVA